MNIGIIPVRIASKRFPNKPLFKIDGKTLLERTYEQASKSKLDKVVVATSDDAIINYCLLKNYEFQKTSDQHICGTERCAEVAEKLSLKNDDIVLNIQGDEPFIKPEQINLIIDYFYNSQAQAIRTQINVPMIATLVVKISSQIADDSNCVKVVRDNKNNAMYFGRAKMPYSGPWLKHIGVYGFEASYLKSVAQLPRVDLEVSESLEQLRWLVAGYAIRLIETHFDPPSINSPEDATALELLLANQKNYFQETSCK